MPEKGQTQGSNAGATSGTGGADDDFEFLVPIKMQLLLYPALQFVNLTTSSFLVHAWLFGGGPNLCRVWGRFAFAQPETQFGTQFSFISGHVLRLEQYLCRTIVFWMTKFRL